MGPPEGLTAATSAEPARWVLDGLVDREHTVRSLVPDGFDAYCRVFHPAYSYDLHDNRHMINHRRVSWADIAAMNGRVMHPEAQFEAIAGLNRYKDESVMDRGQPPVWRDTPEEGSLDREILELLAALLRPHTTTPEHCHFAHWSGYGGMPLDELTAPMFGYPWRDAGRDHLLFEGPVESAALSIDPGRFHSPNVWWPRDHAWLVATDIDLDSTYIGGSEACIAAILEHPEIEALEARAIQIVTRDGDRINPPLRGPTPTQAKRRWFWQTGRANLLCPL